MNLFYQKETRPMKKNNKKDCVYMLVTNDIYELPLAVADSVPELAEILHIPQNRIYSAMSKAKAKKQKSMYIKVEFKEE